MQIQMKEFGSHREAVGWLKGQGFEQREGETTWRSKRLKAEAHGPGRKGRKHVVKVLWNVSEDVYDANDPLGGLLQELRGGTEKPTKKQVQRHFNSMRRLGWQRGQIIKTLEKVYGITNIKVSKNTDRVMRFDVVAESRDLYHQVPKHIPPNMARASDRQVNAFGDLVDKALDQLERQMKIKVSRTDKNKVIDAAMAELARCKVLGH